MQGREEIGKVFSSFLENFDTVYHINGQQTVEVNGDRATSHHYCLVVLVSDSEGKKSKNTNGVIYRDEYVRSDSQWLIAKRIARFTWRHAEELNTPS